MPTQTSNGKAFEYACVIALEQKIKNSRPVNIEINSSMNIAKSFFEALPTEEQTKMTKAALAGAEPLIKAEPKITEDGNDEITLSIQPDSEGIAGDVRDVLIIRRSISWVIGLSVKNNHFAAKHSRISRTIDFGKEWFGQPCSEEYFNSINTVFSFLQEEKSAGKLWRDMPNKVEKVYKPLLEAFKTEIIRLDSAHPNQIPTKLLEYLIGRYDFYKFIKIDGDRKTIVQCYNFHGTLNKRSSTKKPEFSTGVVNLPDTIRYFDYLDSAPDNTLELILNQNWTVTFRIHNASSRVEPSLKFDIKVSGVPSDLFTAHIGWPS